MSNVNRMDTDREHNPLIFDEDNPLNSRRVDDEDYKNLDSDRFRSNSRNSHNRPRMYFLYYKFSECRRD